MEGTVAANAFPIPMPLLFALPERKEYGGMKVDQARRMKDLERENMRLKRLVADLSLDNSILKEAASGNF